MENTQLREALIKLVNEATEVNHLINLISEVVNGGERHK